MSHDLVTIFVLPNGVEEFVGVHLRRWSHVVGRGNSTVRVDGLGSGTGYRCDNVAGFTRLVVWRPFCSILPCRGVTCCLFAIACRVYC